MNSIRKAAALGARLIALAVTGWLLVATSAPICDEWSAPVAFHVDAGCGTAGIVVVEPTDNGDLILHNAELLGLPRWNPTGSQGAELRQDGRVHGYACPVDVTDGGWSVSAVSPTAINAPGRTCRAEKQGEVLNVVCTDGTQATPTCTARLTVVGGEP